MNVSPTDILRLRLAGQNLTTTGPARASDVVRALGAVQSQDYAGLLSRAGRPGIDLDTSEILPRSGGIAVGY